MIRAVVVMVVAWAIGWVVGWTVAGWWAHADRRWRDAGETWADECPDCLEYVS